MRTRLTDRPGIWYKTSLPPAARLADDGAGPWVRMQAAYDAWHAERSTDTSAIPTIKAA